MHLYFDPPPRSDDESLTPKQKLVRQTRNLSFGMNPSYEVDLQLIIAPNFNISR